MKKIKVIKTVDLTEGGCNACGIVKAESFCLELNDRERPLDGLSVRSLVMTIVLAEGWKQEFIMGMMEDHTLFSKGDDVIKLTETFDQVTYESASDSVTVSDAISDESQLFETVNMILSRLFQLETYEFTY